MVDAKQYEEVGKRVTDIIFNYIKSEETSSKGMHRKSVSLDQKFVADLNLDSIDCVEIVMQLEDEFHIGIPDEDFEDKLDGDISVREIARYVADRLYS